MKKENKKQKNNNKVLQGRMKPFKKKENKKPKQIQNNEVFNGRMKPFKQSKY